MWFLDFSWVNVLVGLLAFVALVAVGVLVHRAGKGKDSVVLLINSVVVIGLLAIGPVVALTTVQNDDENLCKQQERSSDSDGADDADDAGDEGGPAIPRISPRATMSLSDEEAPVLDVGHNINAGPQSIAIRLDREIPKPREVRVATPVLRPDERGGAELYRGEVKAWAVLDSSRRSGTVTLCFPPQQRLDGPSGSFSGSVLITDPRIKRAEIPVTVNLAYPNRDRVVFVGLAVCLVASLYVYFLRRPDLDRDDPAADDPMFRLGFDFFLGYWRFATSALGVITIAAGLIGAAGAFSVQYLTSSTWAGAWTDWFAYAGAIGTAYIAAGTAGRLAQNVYDPDAVAARKARKDAKAQRAASKRSRHGASKQRI